MWLRFRSCLLAFGGREALNEENISSLATKTLEGVRKLVVSQVFLYESGNGAAIPYPVFPFFVVIEHDLEDLIGLKALVEVGLHQPPLFGFFKSGNR